MGCGQEGQAPQRHARQLQQVQQQQQDKEAAKTARKKKKKKDPLPGFDRAVVDHILPQCLQVPHRPSFDLADAQTRLLAGEVAALQKCVHGGMPDALAEYLTARYFPSLRCPPELAQEYLQALRDLDLEQFRKYYIQFLSKCRV
ncbi:MAG: hypothetical protein BJ554DRAFT_1681 [Olpidium bornovanus]|uniref:Exportin-T n=1 Tax=Olpidium bornovanus TaxID=278681 RepID=A0A8H8A0X1_9FUNG|nr:MAG: hypothetical protein BJ554DRAFT_1681 [Olpidium bornovanus]